MAARKSSSRSRGSASSSREWVGGVIRTPFFIQDREPAYRAMGIFWLDARDGVIVGTTMVGPDEVQGQVGAVLASAMKRPMVGPPRRPDRIRVATADLADEVRALVGDGVAITIAPTPELQLVLDALTDSMGIALDGDEDGFVTYLANGNVEADTVGIFFDAAKQLYHAAPWKEATDDQIIHVDIPSLGVAGACLSIIGNLGESLGFLLFPSYDSFESFLDASIAAADGDELMDLNTGWLALNYVRGADLPDAVRREISAHGWPVAAPEAYPLAERFDQDLVVVPLCDRDLTMAAAVASALCSFFARHRDRFATDDTPPVRESHIDDQGIEVRLSYPHEADQERLAAAHSAAVSAGDPESELTDRMIDFALATDARGWWEHTRAFTDHEAAEQLAVPWSLYHFEVAGEAVARRFLKRFFSSLSIADREVIAAELLSWLSVWEVTSVAPGASVTLHDQLTGERRTVLDRTASGLLQPHDGILARVVDNSDGAFFSGIHPRSLRPQDLAEMVRLARGHLRRKRSVPVDRLRGGKVGRYLIRKWEKLVQRHDLKRLVPPSLSNTDGDPLLHTSDLFLIDHDGDASQVIARLAAMDGAFAEAADGPVAEFVFERPGDEGGTVVGIAEVDAKTLQLHTNSTSRADALRARVEKACGPLIHHMKRDAKDITAEELQAMVGLGPDQPAERSPELERLELEFKQRHYADWADTPLPALQGRTPREAVRSPDGRQQVDTLLKTMANQESRHKGQWAYDFSGLRAELGLP